MCSLLSSHAVHAPTLTRDNTDPTLTPQHLPEKWGMLQFATGPVNATPAITNKEWPLRSMSAALYYAQHAFANVHNGSYAANATALLPFTAQPWALDGTCANVPQLSLQSDGRAFVSWIVAEDGGMASSITEDRYLRVWSGRDVVAAGLRSGQEGTLAEAAAQSN